MTHLTNGLAHAFANLRFMLMNADMVYPLALAAAAALLVLMSRGLRESLKAPWTRAAFAGVLLSWAALIPWGALWLDAMDGRHPSPGWAGWPLVAVLFGWPLLAAFLILRARGGRLAAGFFVLCNAPGWLLGCFVGAMAVGGDWI
ncbi:hypothetical protein [Caulobacter sp. 17J65-9]|uniref:hypothetical protein n=1 Tax=Caulobacter sp. 17J65-9 TaxID=2709382 RepID=UPI0013CCEB17|nr:hypothetical protein [Caulobacter sp. 17J65-9]NEX95266.1 hypothetical protein [Caulobacter sp. 17J65-9]